MKKELSILDIIEYEVRSHWLSSYISFSWGQDLLAKHIVRQTVRKHKRYINSLEAIKNIQ